MNLGQDVTRIWEFRERSDEIDAQRIVVRHNPVTKALSLSVNGKDVMPADATFKLRGGVSGRVLVEQSGKSFLQMFAKYTYTCILFRDGKDLKLLENNDLLKEMDDGVTDVRVQIPQVVVDGTKTVWYLLRVRYTRVYKGKERVMHFEVHRRFRDFRFAYSQICNAFRGTHMLGSVPQHPPRHAKLLEDHLAPQFLETRRLELESWLRRTLGMPRVGINPDMEAFLGMGDPTMRETSVVVMPNDILGLRLKKREGEAIPGASGRIGEVFPQATVIDFSKGPDGKMGAAEASKLVGCGDVISKIGGESVVYTVYEEIVPRLKTTPRPMLVHFLGYSYPLSKDPTLRSMVPSIQRLPSPAVPTASSASKAVQSLGLEDSEESYQNEEESVDSNGLKDEPKDPNDILGDETDDILSSKPPTLDSLSRPSLAPKQPTVPAEPTRKHSEPARTSKSTSSTTSPITPSQQPKPKITSSAFSSMFARVPQREESRIPPATKPSRRTEENSPNGVRPPVVQEAAKPNLSEMEPSASSISEESEKNKDNLSDALEPKILKEEDSAVSNSKALRTETSLEESEESSFVSAIPTVKENTNALEETEAATMTSQPMQTAQAWNTDSNNSTADSQPNPRFKVTRPAPPPPVLEQQQSNENIGFSFANEDVSLRGAEPATESNANLLDGYGEDVGESNSSEQLKTGDSVYNQSNDQGQQMLYNDDDLLEDVSL